MFKLKCKQQKIKSDASSIYNQNQIINYLDKRKEKASRLKLIKFKKYKIIPLEKRFHDCSYNPIKDHK